MSELDLSATHGMTLYKEVKRHMLLALSANEWTAGQMIPSEKQLCMQMGVSVGTLRKAIDELAAENILIRHQGRGTYVATHDRDQHLFRFFNVVRHDGLKSFPVLELVKFAKSRADKAAREALGMSASALALRFTNMHIQHGEPVLIDEISVPEALFAGLSEAMLRTRPSTLYNLYEREFGLNVIRTEERVRATRASPAHARLLSLDPGAPLLQIFRVAYSYNNHPVEWRVSYVNTERYEYAPAVTQ